MGNEKTKNFMLIPNMMKFKKKIPKEIITKPILWS